MPRLLAVLRVPALLFLVAILRADPAPADAWTLAERFDFNGALARLEANNASRPAASAELRVARAAALLGAQPRTPANIAAALETTRAVAADPATPADARLVARSLEGRILREHLEPRTPENLAAARELFRGLLDSGSEHPLAVRAAVSLGLGLLYDDPSLPRAERLAAAEALLPRTLRHPAVERDLRYVIAHAAMVWGLEPKIARDHLRRVDQIGFSQLPRRLNVRVALGQLAEETGDLALATQAYEAFLAESVRDNRDGPIRVRLAGIARLRAAK